MFLEQYCGSLASLSWSATRYSLHKSSKQSRNSVALSPSKSGTPTVPSCGIGIQNVIGNWVSPLLELAGVILGCASTIGVLVSFIVASFIETSPSLVANKVSLYSWYVSHSSSCFLASNTIALNIHTTKSPTNKTTFRNLKRRILPCSTIGPWSPLSLESCFPLFSGCNMLTFDTSSLPIVWSLFSLTVCAPSLSPLVICALPLPQADSEGAQTVSEN